MVNGNRQFGVHLHSYADFDAALDTIAANGSNVIRYETSWHILQPTTPFVTFNSDSYSLNDSDYEQYLLDRGYHFIDPDGDPAGTLLPVVLAELQAGYDRGFSYVFSNGLTPVWASSAVQGAGETDDEFEHRSIYYPPDDVGNYGEFLQDFVSYVARQGGAELLNMITGWEIGNEANVYDYHTGGNYPVSTYLDLSQQAYTALHDAYDNLPSAVSEPDVSSVSFGGSWDGPNWQQVIDGDVPFDSIVLHPYATKVTPWIDPIVGGWPNEPDQSDHPLSGKILMPTDDYLTWKAATERFLDDDLELFSATGSSADDYLNQNTESGIERTMAQFYANGQDNINVHFTEWGTSTLTGDIENAQYLDPSKFTGGYTYQNAQIAHALVVIETVALISDWDFVETATIYELNDQLANPGDSSGNPPYGGVFGLYDINGVLKPVGEAYFAFVRGEAIDGTNLLAGLHLKIDVAGNDWTETASSAHDLLVGRDGNDIISGGHGDDVIFAGSGNDILNGNQGYDRLYGGAGRDQLNGGQGRDKLKGGAGDDVLTGGTGGDQFAFSVFSNDGSGFSGHDLITDFEVGVDVISVTGGFDVADLLAHATDTQGGVVILLGANGATVELAGVNHSDLSASDFFALPQAIAGDPIFGTLDSDVFLGNSNSETYFALDGDDVLDGLGGTDRLYGGDGDDSLDGGHGNDVLVGGAGNDTGRYDKFGGSVVVNLNLTSAQNTNAGGVETISEIENLVGGVGNDRFVGNTKNNDLRGQGGSDQLFGIGGDDRLSGGNGNDQLLGGNGDDDLNGDLGNDIIDGGMGTDTARYESINGSVIVNLNLTGRQNTNAAGFDVIRNVENLVGGVGNDHFIGKTAASVLHGGGGSDQLFGLGGDDTLSGGLGRDVLLGGAGIDALTGGAGNDFLRGGRDADTINGGAGRDVLFGGDIVGGAFTGDGAADRFVYSDVSDSGPGDGVRDIIRDFEQTLDVIDLSAIDTIIGGGNEAFIFVGNLDFSNTAGELRFSTTTASTIVQADVDGDGASDFEIFLNGSMAMTVGDFVL